MKLSKSLMTLTILSMLVFGIGLASAFEEVALENNRTLIMGNIYNENFSSDITGVQVWFICDNDDSNVESIFVENSSFAITFSSESCPLGSNIDIGAYKEGYDFYGSGGLVHSCDESSYCLTGLDSPGGIVNIVNIAITNINLRKSNESSAPIGALSNFHGGHGNLKKPIFNKTSIASVPEQVAPVVENTPVNENNNAAETPEVETSSTTQTNEEPKGLTGVTGNFLASGASSWLALIVILVASLLVYFLLKKGNSSQMKVPAFPKTSPSHSFY